jgi:ribosomal protein L40E
MDGTSFLDSLKQAWVGDEPGDEELYPDETESPHVNHLLRTARKYADGKLMPGELFKEIQAQSARLEQALREHHVLMQTPGLSEELAGLAAQAAEAYEGFRVGLRLLLTYFDQHDPEVLEQGIEACKTSTARLVRLNKEFAAVQEREAAQRCMMCGHLNPPRARTCARCQAPLPEEMARSAATAEQAASDLVMVPPEYMQLYQACDQVARGDLEVAAWRGVVEAFHTSFSQSRALVEQQVAQYRQQLAEAGELAPVAEALIEGLKGAEKALEDMLVYADDGVVDHLNYGWMDLLAATRKVQESSLIFQQTLQALGVAAAQSAEPPTAPAAPGAGGEDVVLEEEE